MMQLKHDEVICICVYSLRERERESDTGRVRKRDSQTDIQRDEERSAGSYVSLELARQ